MGIFDKIKDVYNKVDEKLGGYLPGGSTPDEVKASKNTPTTSGPSQPYDPSTVSILDQDTQKKIYGQVVNTAGATSSGGSSKTTSTPIISSGSLSGNDSSVQQALQQAQTVDTVTRSSGDKTNLTQPTVTTNQNTNIPQGEIRPATGKEKFYMSPIGQFVSGFKQGPTQNKISTATDLGAMANIGLFATGGELVSGGASLLSKLNLLKSGTKAASILQKAESAGVLIEANGAARIGEPFATKVITNSKQATLVNNVIVNTVKKLNPENYKTVLGLVAGVAGWLTSGVFGLNEQRDASLGLEIAISDAIDNGDIETAEYFNNILRSVEDTNDYLTVLLGPVGYFKSSATKGRVAIEIADKQIEKAKEKQVEDKVSEALDTQLAARIQAGMTVEQIANDEDIKAFALDPDNTYSLTTKLYQQAVAANARNQQQATEEQAQVDIEAERLRVGQELVNKILAQGMNAQQIVDDPEIQAYALDPNNKFSSLTEIYNSAQEAIAKSKLYEEQYAQTTTKTGGTYNKYEGESTLNFGLLKTGEEQVTVDAETGKVIPQSLNQLALDTFGVSYDKLSDTQKATLENK